MITTIVKVTQKHIDNGVGRNSCECPVALAFKDVVRPEVPVFVKCTYASLGMGGFATTLPVNAIKFIHDFDMRAIIPLNGQPDLKEIPQIAPFEFEFDIPEQYLREGIAA